MELEDLASHLNAEVEALCSTNTGDIEGPEDAFTEVMLGFLQRTGQIDLWELGYAQKAGLRGAPAYKINAWHVHSQSATGQDSAPMVDLFISLHQPGRDGLSVPPSKVSEHFQKARNFLEGALTAFGGKLDQMEESAPPYESVQTILRHRGELETARIFLLTNGLVKQAAETNCEIQGLKVKHYLWDLEKMRRLMSDGVKREAIVLDLVNDYDGGIPCVAQEDGTGEYTAYLAFFPATLLAKIYGDYGPRLLEKNVRSYLQARGKVNKGIQTTIRDTPQRFLAYNNGISATAESLKISTDGIPKITQLEDFQIVNGGQTTASIYHAVRKEKADISKISVQVKVTVVHQVEKITELVPLISLYANSQNKVNTADFSSNNLFHQKLESLSRTTWAPAPDGISRPTRWYYERARGSYLDEKARAGTPARQRDWAAEQPLPQKFVKTDVSKYEHAWDQEPQLVAKGAEKNFLEWTMRREKNKIDEPPPGFFEDLVAKAILWRRTEKIVSALKLGGYRANVVAYTIAWLSRDTGGRLDLEAIWKNQALPPALEEAIAIIAKVAFDYLVETAGGRNVTEWAKKDECWTDFRTKKIDLPDLSGLMKTRGQEASGEPSGESRSPKPGAKVTPSDIEKLRPEVWLNLGNWGQDSGNFETWQVTMCENFHRKISTGKKPKQAEAKLMLDLLDTACAGGFTP
jgi:hypothetical protein